MYSLIQYFTTFMTQQQQRGYFKSYRRNKTLKEQDQLKADTAKSRNLHVMALKFRL